MAPQRLTNDASIISDSLARKRKSIDESEPHQKFKQTKVLPKPKPKPKPKQWVTLGSLSLDEDHRQVLFSSGKQGWLDSGLVYAAMLLLRNDYPHIGGLQKTTLSTAVPPAFAIEQSSFIQICHVGGNHWNVIKGQSVSNVLELDIYDTWSKRPHYDNISIASSLVRGSPIREMRIRMHGVEQQKNFFDCGLHAIAFAKLLCDGIDPCTVSLDKSSALRQHYAQCLENRKLDSFPSTRSSVSCSVETSIHGAVHCYCRKVGDETKMVQCSKCIEWFHAECLIHQGVKEFGGEERTFLCCLCSSGLDVMSLVID